MLSISLFNLCIGVILGTINNNYIFKTSPFAIFLFVIQLYGLYVNFCYFLYLHLREEEDMKDKAKAKKALKKLIKKNGKQDEVETDLLKAEGESDDDVDESSGSSNTASVQTIVAPKALNNNNKTD